MKGVAGDVARFDLWADGKNLGLLLLSFAHWAPHKSHHADVDVEEARSQRAADERRC
jgi:hypothetical protein